MYKFLFTASVLFVSLLAQTCDWRGTWHITAACDTLCCCPSDSSNLQISGYNSTHIMIRADWVGDECDKYALSSNAAYLFPWPYGSWNGTSGFYQWGLWPLITPNEAYIDWDQELERSFCRFDFRKSVGSEEPEDPENPEKPVEQDL